MSCIFKNYEFRNYILNPAKKFIKDWIIVNLFLMIKEEDLEEKYFCPNCGQEMEYKKTDENLQLNEKLQDKIQFWYCLNCSAEWQIDILNNILRKNSLIES